jgi:putative intracellular protease/amidase
LARPSQKPILETTKTLAVNAHGALVLLAMKLFAGDPVTLINPQTEEQQPSRVVYIGSRESEKQEVGIVCEAFAAVLANRVSAARLDTRAPRRQRVCETCPSTAKRFEKAMTGRTENCV